MSNQDDLFVQINKYSVQGYRLLESLVVQSFCPIYIKDTSKKSKFVYKTVPDFDLLDGFLAKTNELGARGYRYPVLFSFPLVSNGTISYYPVPLYYRDKTQKDCSFSYTSTPVPNSPDALLALLQKQETKGLIFVTLYFASTGEFLIFEKIRNCEYKSINIDDFY